MLDFLKVLGVFLLVVILITRKLNLGLIMVAGAFILALLFGVWPWAWLKIAFYSCIDPTTLGLVGALILIQWLEASLRKTGLLQTMVASLNRLISDRRLVMAFLPAFLGFLPSAGGARFSAPLVGEASKDLPIPGERKAFINYWFRHIWEPIFPLYPGLIMASAILMVSFAQLFPYQLPYTICMILIGVPLAFWGMRGVARKEKLQSNELPQNRWDDIGKLLFTLAPILIVIVLVLFFKIDLVLALGGVLLAMFVWMLLARGWKLPELGKLIVQAFSLNIVFLSLGVFIFKDTLIQTGAVSGLSAFFQASGVPSLFLVSFLPFMVGLLTGVTPAFVGVTFPLLLGVFGSPIDLSLVALAYGSGLAGAFLSPVHLCLVLTREYFQADWLKLYRLLLPASLSLILVGFLISLF